MKKVFIIIAAVVAIVLTGCTAMLDGITPCYIPPSMIKYADVKPTIFLPFTTIWDMQRVRRHIEKQWTKERLQYEFLKGLGGVHLAAATELQVKVMQPALMGIIGSSGLAIGWLGIPRPGDVKKS